MSTKAFLTGQNLEDAFRELGLRVRAAGKIVEIAVYGGSALVLTLPGRVATKDVDAVVHHDEVWLRDAVAALAEERGWPADWLNDGVKGWLSHRDTDPEAKRLFKTRIGGVDGSQDRSDIEALARVIGIVTAEQALDIVSQYYPLSQVASKTVFGIQELFPPANESGS